MLTLVDTSSWIEALRSGGDSAVRERVRTLLVNARAAWCDIVAVELWIGVRGDYEKKRLAQLEKEIVCLPITEAVWQHSRVLARKCRVSGKTAPVVDMVIAACSLVHGVPIEHCDAHFDYIFQASSVEP